MERLRSIRRALIEKLGDAKKAAAELARWATVLPSTDHYFVANDGSVRRKDVAKHGSRRAFRSNKRERRREKIRALKALVLLCVLLLASPAFAYQDAPAQEEEPSKLYRALGLMNYGLKASDGIATEIIIEQGGRELNPMLEHRAVRISSYVAAPIAINWGTEVLRKRGHGKWALAIRIATVALYGYATARNISQIQ